MNTVYYLVYTSTATDPFADNDLFRLLSRSRVANEQTNISGALIYRNGVFVQMLEGNEQDVEQLREKIYSDPRHTGVLTLIRGYAESRVFGEWTMHFIVNDEGDAQTRDTGYRCLRGTGDVEDMVIERNSYRLPANTDELHPGLRLLLTFRQLM